MTPEDAERWYRAPLQRDRIGIGRPQDVMRIAKNNVIVAHVIDAWQMGAFRSWEEAMTAAVVYLADQNERLMRDAVNVEMLKPMPSVIIKGDK